jgi:hypothetical protein
MRNRLVTRGLSTKGRNRLVTQGFGSFFERVVQEVVEVSKRIIKVGGTAARRVSDQLEEIVVYARLISVNSVQPDEPVKGWIRITYDRSRRIVVNAVQTAVNTIKTKLDEILISIRRIK